VPPPPRVEVKAQPRSGTGQTNRKWDRAAADALIRQLGEKGEEFVVSLERERLTAAGRSDLAAAVTWVAKTDDGRGYDVLSFESDGPKLLIEVKTTTGTEHTPFYVTANELAASKHHGSSYCLYRVFDFGRKKPRIYVTKGDLEAAFSLRPTVFSALR
jgi:hypothetical protein